MATNVAVKLGLLEFYAGNRRDLNFQVFDIDQSVTPAVKTPRNITDDTIKWAISRITGGTYSSTPVLQKSSATGGGIEKTDPGSGWCRVSLLKADTDKLLGDYHQELEDFDLDGESQVVAVGLVRILLNVKNT